MPALPVHVPGTLLDVREIDEWKAGRAVGAVHIPMSEVPARLDEIDLDEPVYVICRSGVRSARVAAWLNEHGGDALERRRRHPGLAGGEPPDGSRRRRRAPRPLTAALGHRNASHVNEAHAPFTWPASLVKVGHAS